MKALTDLVMCTARITGVTSRFVSLYEEKCRPELDKVEVPA